MVKHSRYIKSLSSSELILFKYRSLKWFLLCVLCTHACGEFFNSAGNDMRATDSTWQITATADVTKKTQCLQVCSRNTECGGCNFKEDGVNSLCEILPAIAIVKNSDMLSLETGWQFYRKVSVISPMYLSNEQLLCMPYDGYSGNPIPKPLRQSVTCTGAAYILNLWNAGYKNCKFTREDNRNFYGSDITTVDGNTATVWQLAFSKCHLHACIGIICYDTRCWLKYKNHISDPTTTSYAVKDNVFYWYATCQ